MKIDAVTYGGPLGTIAADVRSAEGRGYDGWFVSETAHDPLLACVAAGGASERLEVGTAIAVAFPRSPMHVAYAAHDLQELTGGRFVLGLGSQVKAHVEKRFSATWSQPAARLREYVLALRAIWRAWEEGEELSFRGAFYRHTLMTPFFSPPAHGLGAPKVWLAAVGPRMTEVTGEVADGLLCHAFTTRHYLDEVTLPKLAAGASLAGRSPADIEISLPVFVVTGRDAAETAQVAHGVKGQIAFYGSTPAYRAVLDRHGWGALHDRLHQASLRGEWAAMSEMIDDEVLDAFAIVAPPDEVGARILERYGTTVDRISLATGFRFDDADWSTLTEVLRGRSTT